MRNHVALTFAAVVATSFASMSPAVASQHPCTGPVDSDCYVYDFDPPLHCDIYITDGTSQICIHFGPL